MRFLLYLAFVVAATLAWIKVLIIPDWCWTDYYIGSGKVITNYHSVILSVDETIRDVIKTEDVDKSQFSYIVGLTVRYSLLLLRMATPIIPIVLLIMHRRFSAVRY